MVDALRRDITAVWVETWAKLILVANLVVVVVALRLVTLQLANKAVVKAIMESLVLVVEVAAALEERVVFLKEAAVVVVE
jgi:hypothetical protein